MYIWYTWGFFFRLIYLVDTFETCIWYFFSSWDNYLICFRCIFDRYEDFFLFDTFGWYIWDIYLIYFSSWDNYLIFEMLHLRHVFDIIETIMWYIWDVYLIHMGLFFHLIHLFDTFETFIWFFFSSWDNYLIYLRCIFDTYEAFFSHFSHLIDLFDTFGTFIWFFFQVETSLPLSSQI